MSRPISGNLHRIPGQSISWAGECPWTNTLVFGSEAGWLAIMLPGARPTGGEFIAFNLTTAAINGAAFNDDLMAISSPAEVAIYRWRPDLVPMAKLSHPFSGGAFGLVGTGDGRFLAPIGTDGLLLLDPSRESEETRSTRLIRADNRRQNYFKILDVSADASGRTFACASRRDGLVGLHYAGGRIDRPWINHRPRNEDIVDACNMASREHPRAVACIGRSRGIHLFHDVLDDRPPISVRFEEFEGTAYSIASIQSHLFILTDKALYVLPASLDQFLQAQPDGNSIGIFMIATQASEIVTVGSDRLLLLEDSGVLEYSAAELIEKLGKLEDQCGSNPEMSSSGPILSITSKFNLTHPDTFDAAWLPEFHTSQFAP